MGGKTGKEIFFHKRIIAKCLEFQYSLFIFLKRIRNQVAGSLKSEVTYVDRSNFSCRDCYSPASSSLTFIFFGIYLKRVENNEKRESKFERGSNCEGH